MKTPGILILLSIFLICGNAAPITEIIEKIKDPRLIVIEENLTGDDLIVIEENLTGDDLTASASAELDPITLAQLITSNACYLVTDTTWPDVLDDFVSVDLRLRLNDWCGRFSKFIVPV